MRLARSIAAVVALVALTAASRTQKAPPAPPPPRPPAVAPGEQSKILDLGRIVMRVPIGTKIGRVTCDASGGGSDIVSKTSNEEENVADFKPAFFEQVRREGYRLTQAESSLFARQTDRGTDAQLIVAGTITSLYVENCVDRMSRQRNDVGNFILLFKTPHVKATLTIAWEVYDQLQQRVIFTTSTTGEANVPHAPAPLTAIVAAFGNAADSLLVQPEFHRIATAASAPAPDTATPQTPAANTVIAKLPLSTAAFQQQANNVLGQVVTVMLGQSFGSGFYITDTLLLTNQHVVGLSQYVKVRSKSGKEVIGEVLSRDAARDVALIRTESIGAVGLPLRTEDPGIGSPVYVIGTPLAKGLAESVSSGIVSGFREINRRRFIQSEANTQHGNSGGPMIDDKGNVVGMSDLGFSPEGVPSGINFFIPIGEALQALNVTFAGS